jgi:hypothetical protein
MTLSLLSPFNSRDAQLLHNLIATALNEAANGPDGDAHPAQVLMPLIPRSSQLEK